MQIIMVNIKQLFLVLTLALSPKMLNQVAKDASFYTTSTRPVQMLLFKDIAENKTQKGTLVVLYRKYLL